MYNTIKNPITNRLVNTNSNLGQQIISNYLSVQSGGTNPHTNEEWSSYNCKGKSEDDCTSDELGIEYDEQALPVKKSRRSPCKWVPRTGKRQAHCKKNQNASIKRGKKNWALLQNKRTEAVSNDPLHHQREQDREWEASERIEPYPGAWDSEEDGPYDDEWHEDEDEDGDEDEDDSDITDDPVGTYYSWDHAEGRMKPTQVKLKVQVERAAPQAGESAEFVVENQRARESYLSAHISWPEYEAVQRRLAREYPRAHAAAAADEANFKLMVYWRQEQKTAEIAQKADV